MEKDDIVYLTLLIFTIVFGHFFRQLKNTPLKKWTSTGVGFVIVFLVSGKHAAHPIICVLVNSFIILRVNKRMCHTLSFCFTFSYLIFFRISTYFGIPNAPNHTNMIQMILTLKIVGLAFEIHDSHSPKKGEDAEEDKIRITFYDVIHYCFCHIGVLTGPYYSYRTFRDYHELNFGKYASCVSETLKKLTFIPVFVSIHLLSSTYYPIKYVESDEFYAGRSFWYRLFYIVPVFITFRMRIYVGLILSECACTMAGLGAYPAYSESKPGKGPTRNVQLLKDLKKDEILKKQVPFNFETVKNIDTWYTEFDPSVRSSIRYWNMCVQYWMVFIVYKRFPIKALRTAATFAVSAIWHGIYAGYFLCLCVVPFYLPIESIWENLLRSNATGQKRKVLDLLYWFVRTQAFSYMGMAFSLLTLELGLKYYASVYYVYHITSIIALVSGVVLTKLTGKKAIS